MKGLSISGGGSKGAYAVGVIKRLEELNLKFNAVVGTSTGALLSPLAACGYTKMAEEIYTSVTTRDIIRKRFWFTLPWASSLYKSWPLKKTINKGMTDGMYAKLTSAGTPRSLVCTVNLNSEQTCYWEPGTEAPEGGVVVTKEVFCRALLASSNQPGLMEPIQVLRHGDYHVDGGVREVAPIKKLVDLGCTEIYAIVLDPLKATYNKKKFNRIIPTMLKSLELLVAEVRLNDVEGIPRNIRVRVIKPAQDLPIDGLTFEPDTMKKLVHLGYKDACGQVG